MSNHRKSEIYLYDDMPHPEMQNLFRISENEDRSIIIVMAGMSGDHTITIATEGNNAHADVIIMPLLWGSQSYNLVVNQSHLASNSSSTVRVVAAVSDYAHCAIQVITHSEKHIENVFAEQHSNILLLSPHAHALTVPAIQSVTRNVHCKHGAVLSAFDYDQLAYMKSRAIDEHKARALLCESFLLAGMNHVLPPEDQQLLRNYLRQPLCRLCESL